MRRHPSVRTVELRDITGSRELEDLRVLHLDDPTAPVREIALVTDIEELAAVGPDTVALLTPDVARGGWMISAALRYAWERRASAIIVPEQSFTETVIELARRLGVSLLTTNRDTRKLAIEVAIQVGVAQAGTLARVQRFTEQVAQSNDIRTALQRTSDELDGAPIAIEAAGTVALRTPRRGSSRVASRLTDPQPGEASVRVEVPIQSIAAHVDTLVAEVPAPLSGLAERILHAATPSVRALLADGRLNAARDSLPLLSIAALTGDALASATDGPELATTIEELGWPISGDYCAVFLWSDRPQQAGSAVHQFWIAELPTAPLARLHDGWIGFVSTAGARAREDQLASMRERLERLRPFAIRVGVSRRRSAPLEAHLSVREAWLAARTADSPDAGGSSLVAFEQVSSRLLPSFFPPETGHEFARMLLPRLLEDPGAAGLIDAVVAFLSHRGSTSAAAEHLGVHRNTLQARLRRAEDLGVRLSDPDDVLPTHMLLSALQRRRS